MLQSFDDDPGNVTMTRLTTMLLSILLLVASGASFAADAAKAAQPMAVLISADWCMNCKIIKPKLHEAYQGFENKIMFVSLDVTDDATFARAQKQALQLGVPQLLSGSLATGWVALFDRNRKQVGKLMQDMSVEDMRKALQALVAAPG
jgi:thiol-disulfide isomerase/thioredoxin